MHSLGYLWRPNETLFQNIHDTSFIRESTFLKNMMLEKLVKKDSLILFFDIVVDSIEVISRTFAIINPKTREIYIEEPTTNISTDSFVNLLDIISTLEYETCYVLIDKKKQSKLKKNF